MFTMQGFQKWLTSATEASNDYRDYLARLARLNRDQILRATDDLTWVIWHEVSQSAVVKPAGHSELAGGTQPVFQEVTRVWKLFEAIGETPPDLPTWKELAALA